MNPENLHDIVEPAAVSWMPQTIGWLVLGALVLALGAWWSWRSYRRWRANAYRRAALLELDAIRAEVLGGEGTRSGLSRIPELVKRVALASAPRADVAALSGAAWLEYLDRTGGGSDFTAGAGRHLPLLAYGGPAEVGRVDVDAILALVDRWIRTHTAPPVSG